MPERRPMVLEPFRRTMADARAFAYAVHKGQTDKAGRPYTTHLVMVHDRLTDKIYGQTSQFWEDAQQIAWLHDVIEDTGHTADDLLAEGFSQTVVEGVSCLSNVTGRPYPEFIQTIVDNASLPVLLVKMADLEDNLDPIRLGRLPGDVRAGIKRHREPALLAVRAAAKKLGWRDIGESTRCPS